jgi:hypothetical protein
MSLKEGRRRTVVQMRQLRLELAPPVAGKAIEIHGGG